MLAALTVMRILPGPACGSGASPRWMTSGPPYSSNCKAHICTTSRSAPASRLARTRLVRRRCRLGGGQSGHEGFLRHLHPAHHLHPLLAFLLLLQELSFAGDIAAVALGQHVLPDGADRFSSDHS